MLSQNGEQVAISCIGIQQGPLRIVAQKTGLYLMRQPNLLWLKLVLPKGLAVLRGRSIETVFNTF